MSRPLTVVLPDPEEPVNAIYIPRFVSGNEPARKASVFYSRVPLPGKERLAGSTAMPFSRGHAD